MFAWLFSMATSALACPTVVTGTTQSLTYDTARTAIVHQDGRTTFTVSINPSGTSQDFALVLPVPALLAESDIAVLDSEVFTRLEGYTGLLTMPDAGCAPAGGSSGGDGGGSGGGESESDGSVTVEARYVVGDYAITILSSTDSSALFSYLDAEGYHLAEATVPVLEDYIAEGMYFMTAKVSAEATVADGSALPPLQVAYNSDVYSIPIRLAAQNSPGKQDMLIYAINEAPAGRVGISNYSEFAIEDKCIWGDPATDAFGTFYEALFQPAWEDAGFAAWTVEWAGGPYSCSPCSGVQLSDDDLLALGFRGTYEDAYVTRLHLRYTPTTATQDLMLYTSSMNLPKATSFADDNASNRECIPVCGEEGGADGGGTGGADGGAGGGGESGETTDAPAATPPTGSDSADKSSGCAVTSTLTGAGCALAALLLAGRRRRDGNYSAGRRSV